MSVGIYIRVSTLGQNIDSQKREIQRWLDGNRIENATWFIDKSTGTNLDRRAFEKLQTAIFNGEIKTVVCWKLDRISRSLKDGINVLCDWCERGLRVVATSQQIDFNGSLGKILAAVLLGVAQMENETRRERQAAGIRAAKERGVYLGRQPGFRKSKPDRAAILRGKGLTASEISQAMGVSVRTVFRYLGQEAADVV